MDEIIDVASDVGSFAGRLVDAGVKTVIRYYNHRNVSLPTKCLTSGEIEALHGAGLSVAVVFEQRAGAAVGGGDRGHIEDFGEAKGVGDARRALDLARQLNQPESSAIYFAVDFDFVEEAELAQIAQYFQKVKETLAGRYRVGVYGSGMIGQLLKDRGLVELIWLAGAKRWTGIEDALREGRYTIRQKAGAQPFERFTFDGNVLNPEVRDFGQFGAVVERLAESEAIGRFRVVAEALNLRAGPGTGFDIKASVPHGTIVTISGRDGSWLKVNLDGFMSERHLEAVSADTPAPLRGDLPNGVRPIDIAREEMRLGVAEIPGPVSNPRITQYHETTTGDGADEDVRWCSSFVNFCVEKVGLQGTRNRMAQSWSRWGRDVTTAPEDGDIAVFRTGGPGSGSGHVGFYIGREGDKIRVLGGNQSDRVGIGLYPRDGMMGGQHCKLLSIRRGPG